MKKISFAITGLMVLFLLASCSGAAKGPKVDEVSSTEVISIATESGVQFKETAKPVTSAKVFEEELLPSISSDLTTAMNKTMENLPLGNFTPSKRAAITEADLEKSANDLETQINKLVSDVDKAMMDVMSGKDVSLSIDWQAPLGELKVQDGLDFEIRDAAIKADVSVTSPDKGKSYSASANADFVIDYSATENLKKLCNIDTIPVVKFSALSDCSADFSGDFNLSSIMAAMMGMNSTDVAAIEKMLTELLNSFSGSINGTAALSGGIVFNTNDFAGVITVDTSITVKEDLNADTLAKYVALAMQAENMKEPTKEFFEALPVDISLVVSVYDKDGEKQFDYINANSLYDVYTAGVKFDLDF